MNPGETITTLLRHWREDLDAQARDRLMAAVYEELRRLARGQIAGNFHAQQTMNPTALVHEAYLKLVRQDRFQCENRLEFFGMATLIMRRILVDHARKRLAAKRGSGVVGDEFSEESMASQDADAEAAIAVHDALEKLAVVDVRQAKIVELRYFGGFSSREVAELMDETEQAVDREWRIAKAWLKRKLGSRY